MYSCTSQACASCLSDEGAVGLNLPLTGDMFLHSTLHAMCIQRIFSLPHLPHTDVFSTKLEYDDVCRPIFQAVITVH